MQVRRLRDRGVIASVAAILLVVGTVVWAQWRLDEMKAQMAALESRLSSVVQEQAIVAAALNAQEPTTTPGSDKATSTAGALTSQVAPGATRVIARVLEATPTAFGWRLLVRPGTYLEGPAAFSMASSRGELANSDGSYAFSDADAIEVRLVRDAQVVLAERESGSTRKVDTAEFVSSVVPGGQSYREVWGDAWYWLDIREPYVVAVRQQVVQ